MALAATTKQEIKSQVAEGIVAAFKEINIPSLAETVKDHDEWINGNGKEGMKTTVPLMKKDIELLIRFMEEIKSLMKWLMGLVFGTVVLAVLNLIIH